jgi:hypothetical protein
MKNYRSLGIKRQLQNCTKREKRLANEVEAQREGKGSKVKRGRSLLRDMKRNSGVNTPNEQGGKGSQKISQKAMSQSNERPLSALSRGSLEWRGPHGH